MATKTYMRRWTDAKLNKELAFARAIGGSDTRNVGWLAELEAELKRRENSCQTAMTA